MTLSGTNQGSPMNTASIDFHMNSFIALDDVYRMNAGQILGRAEILYSLGFCAAYHGMYTMEKHGISGISTSYERIASSLTYSPHH
jgi:hypothetical protein